MDSRNNHKYKVGQKVRVVHPLRIEAWDSCMFVPSMTQHIGNVVTIKKHITTDLGQATPWYKIEESIFTFIEDWLEPLDKQMEFNFDD